MQRRRFLRNVGTGLGATVLVAGCNGRDDPEAGVEEDGPAGTETRVSTGTTGERGSPTPDRPCSIGTTEEEVASLSGDWPMAQRDPRNTGATTASVPECPVDEVWTYPTETQLPVTPIVHEEMVYIATYGDTVYALSTATAETVWEFTAEGFNAAPATDGERVYIPAGGTTYAVAPREERQFWATDAVSHAATTAITVADGTVFQATLGTVFALRATDGVVRWKRYVPGEHGRNTIATTPAVTGDHVLVGTYDHRLLALDRSNGDVVWTRQLADVSSNNPPTAPTVVDDTVYVGTYDGQVYALEEDSGRTVWRHALDATLKGSFAVADGRLYLLRRSIGGDRGIDTEARRLADGERVWTTRIRDGMGQIWGPPTVGDGVVVAPSPLTALDAATGEIRWRSPRADPVGGFSEATLLDGLVLAGSTGGLHAVGGG